MINIKTYAVTKAAAKDGNYIYYGGSGGGFAGSTSTASKIEPHYLWGQLFDGTQDIDGDFISTGTVKTKKLIFVNGTGSTLQLDDFKSSSGNIISLSSTTINNSGNFFNDGDITNKGNINNLGKITTNQLEAVSGYIQTLLGVDWTVENLTVTKAAHFFKLIIDEIKATQGAIIVTPANAKIDKVTNSGNNYVCYFRTTDPTTHKQIYNNFEINDQVVCQTFNAATGTSYNVSNKYYWTLVYETGTTTVDNISYHYVKLHYADRDPKSNGVPAPGDEIVLLGNRNDASRQNAIVISAYNSQFLDAGLKAPSIVQYSGINNYNLSSHRLNIISNGLNSFKGAFTTSDGKDVKQSFDTISGTVTTHTTNIASLSATCTGLTSTVQSHTNSISTINTNVSNVSGQVSTNTSNISTLQQTASSLTSSISSNTKSISDLTTTVNNVNTKVDTNATNISTLQQTASSLTSSISEQSKSITSVTNSVGELEKKVTTNTNSISTLQQTATGLSASVSANAKIINDMSGQVEQNKTDIANLKVTATGLTSTVQSLSGTVMQSESKIEQTADNIRMEVMSCGVDIDNKRIKLNGDTLIEGNVTVQNADVGFTLQGDGGTTQIIATSIGTLDAFKQKTTVALTYKGQTYSVGTYSSNGKYIHNNCSILYNLGEFKSGKVVTITGFTTTLTPSSNVSSLNNTFEFYVDGVKKSYVNMAGTSKPSWNYNYTMPSKGILQIKRILKLITNTSAQYNISTTLAVKYSTDAYGQISYDGMGFNLGNGGRIFANTSDGIVMENDNWGIKVAPNMMYKRMPTGKTFTEDNGTVRTDTASSTEYGLKNGLYEFNKHRTRSIQSTGFLYIQPSDEIITCYVSDRSKVYVMLGDPSKRAGQHITFLNCGNVYVSPTSNGLSNELQLSNASFVTEAYCDGVYWFLFAKNVTHMFNSSSKYSQ